MPGGGQVGLVAPPPPPPADPERIVVSASNGDDGGTLEVAAANEAARTPAALDIARMGEHAVVRFEREADAATNRSAATPVVSVPATLRLLVMRTVIQRAVANLPTASRPEG
jgi:hypothetical protein